MIAIFVVGWCVHKRSFFMDVSGYYDSSEEVALAVSLVACFGSLPKCGGML